MQAMASRAQQLAETIMKYLDDKSNKNLSKIQDNISRYGLRLGEAFALTWNDIDFEARTILEKGAYPKDVQARLGHKNIEETLQIYAHVTSKMQDKSINILDEIP